MHFRFRGLITFPIASEVETGRMPMTQEISEVNVHFLVERETTSNVVEVLRNFLYILEN